MATITITIDVPEGADVQIKQDAVPASTVEPDQVKRYFRDYLSDNGRKLYQAAARIELHSGTGYTLADIAENLDITYESAQSLHRTSGRSARRWADDTNTEAPIRLIHLSYDWVAEENGMRSRYRLPDGVADLIVDLQ